MAATLIATDGTSVQAGRLEKQPFLTLSYLTAASDCRGHFGRAFGVHVEELALLARSLFVTDRKGVLTHIDIVSEFGDEPDYMSAMHALADIL